VATEADDDVQDDHRGERGLGAFLGRRKQQFANGSRPSGPGVSASRIASERRRPVFRANRISLAFCQSSATLVRPVPTAARSRYRCSSWA
jgi:hypothetical protein